MKNRRKEDLEVLARRLAKALNELSGHQCDSAARADLLSEPAVKKLLEGA